MNSKERRRLAGAQLFRLIVENGCRVHRKDMPELTRQTAYLDARAWGSYLRTESEPSMARQLLMQDGDYITLTPYGFKALAELAFPPMLERGLDTAENQVPLAKLAG